MRVNTGRWRASSSSGPGRVASTAPCRRPLRCVLAKSVAPVRLVSPMQERRDPALRIVTLNRSDGDVETREEYLKAPALTLWPKGTGYAPARLQYVRGAWSRR